MSAHTKRDCFYAYMKGDNSQLCYLAGYILKDIATNKLALEQLVKAGKAFSFTTHMKPGYEAKESLATGTPMVAVRIQTKN